MINSVACPSCASMLSRSFFRIPKVPTNSCILLQTAEDARGYPRGDIDLSFCEACGFVWNSSMDLRLTEYSGRYEETQGFSPTFRVFQESLAGQLIDRYDVRDKKVIEIGCGKGEFLELLCRLGNNAGTGFDPAYVDERGKPQAGAGVQVVKDFYSDRYAIHKADLVCCKMTLEHIPKTSDFVGLAKHAVRESGGIVYFQIPESGRIFKQCAFEDIYYEHCSYFTPPSLRTLFERHGFEVLRVATEYGDQYLTIEARLQAGAIPTAAWPAPEELETLRKVVDTFSERCARAIAGWRRKLQVFAREGKRIVIWGSGSKGVAFLSAMGDSHGIQKAVDINPYRQGHFMPGSGVEIVAPEYLANSPPDIVIVMNRVYVSEITADLERAGLTPQILAL